MSATGLRGIFQGKTGAGFTAALKRGTVAIALAATALFSPAGNGDVAADELKVNESHTAHSQELNDLTHRFNSKLSDVKIISIDPDWFQLNAALNNRSFIDPAFMRKLIATYVQEESGVTLGQKQIDTIRNMMALDLDNTYSIHVPHQSGRKFHKVCFLFSAGADQDKATQLKQYMLGIRPGIHTGIASLPLSKNIRPALQDKYNKYHEITHCLDSRYVDEAMEEPMSPAAGILHAHRGETNSEVLGGLLLAHDGISNDIVPERRDVRLGGNAMLGPVAYRLKSKIPFPGGRNSGFVYAFYPALKATQEKIDELGGRIRTMPMSELVKIAEDITQTHMLRDNEALGAQFLWRNLYDLDQMEEVAGLRVEAERDTNLDYKKAYNFAWEFREAMNEALPRVLDFGSRLQDGDALSQIAFSFERGSEGQLKPDFGVDDIRPVSEIRDELFATATARTPEALIKSYEDYKNENRAMLETGTEKQRRVARYTLSVASEALRLGLRDMERAAMQTAQPSPR